MTLLHRFACHACGASLSARVRVLDEPALLARHESHTWLVGESGFLPAGSALVPPWLGNRPGFHGWIAPQPRARVALAGSAGAPELDTSAAGAGAAACGRQRNQPLRSSTSCGRKRRHQGSAPLRDETDARMMRHHR